MNPVSTYVQCAKQEIHVTVWNPEAENTVILWHGLVRTGRDFDPLAKVLSQQYRVLAPDSPGRGLSQWADDPEREYTVPFYAEIALDLLEYFAVQKVRWLGTSMGGLLGMMLAVSSLKDRITHLVLNDIGPQIEEGATARIAQYVSNPPVFATITQAIAYIRDIYSPYGDLSENEWIHLAETSTRRLSDGTWTTHYDPRIAEPFAHIPADYHLWEIYDQIECPTIVLRGANSDLLSPAVAEQMTKRGPKCALYVIPECGHAPFLNTPDQIGLIQQFFRR